MLKRFPEVVAKRPSKETRSVQARGSKAFPPLGGETLLPVMVDNSHISRGACRHGRIMRVFPPSGSGGRIFGSGSNAPHSTRRTRAIGRVGKNFRQKYPFSGNF